jgi:hypothetical protein
MKERKKKKGILASWVLVLLVVVVDEVADGSTEGAISER